MISDALKKAIYVSVPSTVIMGSQSITIKKEYADRMTAPPASSDYPITTLNYFSDTKDANSSSLNELYRTDLIDIDISNNIKDVRRTIGKRRHVTLSLHCQAIDKAVSGNKYFRNDIAAQMITDLEVWASRDLPAVLETYNAVMIRENPIPQLDLEGESIAHMVYDIIILYGMSYTQQITTIDYFDYSMNAV